MRIPAFSKARFGGSRWGPGGGQAAFTMVEIALCLGIIAFALVAIIGVMPTGLQVQRNNREDTILTRDGQYFLEAIRSGALGSMELTNHVLAITLSNSVGDVFVHTMQPNSPAGLPRGGQVVNVNNLTNSQVIISLLSTPRYTTDNRGRVVTNYVHALVRSVTGTAEEKSNQWRSRDAGDFLPPGFVYMLSTEVVPLRILPPVLTNWTATGLSPTEVQVYSNNWLQARNQATNFSELRLTLQGPVYLSGPVLQVAGRPRTFRTMVSGQLALTSDNWMAFQPGVFTQATP
jgi:type II secretory pathway pseudopilin PulG